MEEKIQEKEIEKIIDEIGQENDGEMQFKFFNRETKIIYLISSKFSGKIVNELKLEKITLPDYPSSVENFVSEIIELKIKLIEVRDDQVVANFIGETIRRGKDGEHVFEKKVSDINVTVNIPGVPGIPGFVRQGFIEKYVATEGVENTFKTVIKHIVMFLTLGIPHVFFVC
jgi:hypothetical protein